MTSPNTGYRHFRISVADLDVFVVTGAVEGVQ
jgi:hypothetical protein